MRDQATITTKKIIQRSDGDTRRTFRATLEFTSDNVPEQNSLLRQAFNSDDAADTPQAGGLVMNLISHYFGDQGFSCGDTLRRLRQRTWVNDYQLGWAWFVVEQKLATGSLEQTLRGNDWYRWADRELFELDLYWAASQTFGEFDLEWHLDLDYDAPPGSCAGNGELYLRYTGDERDIRHLESKSKLFSHLLQRFSPDRREEVLSAARDAIKGWQLKNR